MAERITQQHGGEDPVSSANLAKEEQIKPLIRFDTIGPAIDLIDAAKFYGTVAVRRMNWRESDPTA